MAAYENNLKVIPKENSEFGEYNNTKEECQLSLSDNKFQKNDINSIENNNIINISDKLLEEKYIIDKDITNDVIINEIDESTNIPIKII